MSLAEEARTLAAPRGPSCTAGQFLSRLTDEQRAEIADAEAQGVPATALVAAMKARGWNPPASAVWTRHRRTDCSCE